MKKRIVLSLSIMIGMATFFIPCLQVGRAASPSQPDCPSCNSFGVQRSQEKKEAPAFSLKGLDGNQVSPQRLQGETCPHHFLGHLVYFLSGRNADIGKILPGEERSVDDPFNYH